MLTTLSPKTEATYRGRESGMPYTASPRVPPSNGGVKKLRCLPKE
ncbi:MAG: hypothetical protein ABF325_11700 [Lentimonas sp.]